MIEILGLLISCGFLIWLSFRNWNIAVSCLIAGAILMLTNDVNLWEGFSVPFSEGFADFAQKWWIFFALGSIFGQCMQKSGMSSQIACAIYSWCGGKAIPAVVLISFALSYGGISTFIIAFTVYPIAVELFRRSRYHESLLPSAILFAPTTLCMTMLPGTPSIQNMIPSVYLDTDIYAAPGLGLMAAVITGVLGMLYLHWMAGKLPSCVKADGAHGDTVSKQLCPADYSAFLPCIVLWILAFLLIKVGLDSQMAVASALLAGSVVCLVLRIGKFDYKNTINTGIVQGLQTLASTSCIMGYGTLVRSTAGFERCISCLPAFDGPQILSGLAGINLIAAITGSSTASLQMFYQIFGEQALHWGLSAASLHRITAIASGGLDSMPYATGVMVATDLVGTEMKRAYPHIFVTCAVIPIFTLLFLMFTRSIFPWF